MARHSTTADRAFEMLRDHSQHNGHKLGDLAAAVVESHLLLPPPAWPATPNDTSPGSPQPRTSTPADGQ